MESIYYTSLHILLWNNSQSGRTGFIDVLPSNEVIKDFKRKIQQG